MAAKRPRKPKTTTAPAPAPATTTWQGGRFGDRIPGEPYERGGITVGMEPWDFGQGTLYFGPGIEHLRERWEQWQTELGRVGFPNGKPGCGVWLTRGALGLYDNAPDVELPSELELWDRKPDFRAPWMSDRPRWAIAECREAMPVVVATHPKTGRREVVHLPSRNGVWEQRYAKVDGDQKTEIESRFELVAREWLSHQGMLRFHAVEAALEEHPEWDEDSPEMDPVYEAHPIPECMNPKGTPSREARARFREAVQLWKNRAVKQTGKADFEVLNVPRRGPVKWTKIPEMWEAWGARSPWYGEATVGGIEIPKRRWYFLFDEDRVWDARWQAWSQVIGLLIEGFVPGGA